MRTDWIHRPLGDVCKVVGGGTPSKREPDLYKGVIPWATVRDMRHEILSETQFSITHEAIKSSTTNVIPGGNVVIATRVGLGKVCLLQQDTAINQDLRGIIPKSDNLDVRYLFRWFQSIADDIEAEGTGATVKGVKLTFVKGLNLPIPSLSEQKSIVKILDDAFLGIDAAIANTEKNLANAKELFESYLNGLISPTTSLWERGPLIAFVDSVSTGPFGSLLHKSDYVTDGVPLVNPINIVGTEIKPNTKKMISESTKTKLTNYLLKHGDLVIARRGEIGRCAVVTEAQDGWVCGTGCFFIRPSNKANSQFLAHLLRSIAYRDQLEKRCSGATMLNLSNKALATLPISLPKVSDQQRINEQIDDLSLRCNEIKSLYQDKIRALNELKQSLLQKAFSGELTSSNVVELTAQKQSTIPLETNTPEFTAHIMAAAYHWHASQSREKTFGRVKAQKTLHLMESLANIDLGRQPIKDAAGPNDFQHMQRAEDWARDRGFFEFVKRPTGQRGYDFRKGARYGDLVAEAMQALAPYEHVLKRVVKVLMPLNTAETEILATVYAAWNNLLLESIEPTENAIIHEARENWHADKLKYSEEQFRNAISQLRQNGLVPQGRGKRVTGQESLTL